MRSALKAMAAIMFILAMASVASMFVDSDAADAEGIEDIDIEVEGTYYCYGNKVNLRYPYDLNEGMSIEWEVIPKDTTYRPGSDGTSILLDLTETVTVIQTVRSGDLSDSKTISLIPIHLLAGHDEIRVVFMDGGVPIGIQIIDSTKVVTAGTMHIIPPQVEKEGFTLKGWMVRATGDYLDVMNPLDPSMLDGNSSTITLDAVWSSAGGNTASINVGQFIVTFQAVNGLRYDILSTSTSSVEFLVSVEEGSMIDISSVRVSSTYGNLSGSDGRYTLSGIDRNITVTITADRMYTMDYSTKHASVSVDGFGINPEYTLPGHLKATISSSFGWSGLDVKVFMDGRDVTVLYVDGDTIDIPEVTGNIVIVAESTFPWLYVLIVVVIVVIASVVYMIYKRRKERS